MLTLKKSLTSSIGKKYLMSLTGLALLIFLITHLLGNISLYKLDGGQTFNAYTKYLASFGVLLYIAEIGLVLTFLVHIIAAFTVKKSHSDARPVGYKMYRSKGIETSNVSSRNMIVTGIVILVFLIVHVWQFKFGPSVPEGYVTQLNGEPSRDLARLVNEVFHNPLWVIGYVSVMIFVGFHLRHGFWSAFQSLGAMTPRLSKPIYCLGVITAFLLSVGFLFIPIWIYFDLGGALK
ncbi:MAG: succinate dehydrogenase cytochrome b subunit [Oligoflexia bacterium]|nr:succinate dehydrogenase cytochrome b subunit [Oligoflexia bacterium]